MSLAHRSLMFGSKIVAGATGSCVGTVPSRPRLAGSFSPLLLGADREQEQTERRARRFKLVEQWAPGRGRG